MYFSDRVIYVNLNNGQWLLFNTLSGSIDIVDEFLANNLKAKEWSAIPQEMKTILVERGYVFESHQKEESEFFRLAKLVKERDAMLPPEFVVIPTYHCNLKCRYCYEGGIRDKAVTMNAELLLLFWQAIDDIAKAYTFEGTPQVTILGGEPLLKANNKIVANVLEGSFKRNWKVEVITNGTTLTQYTPILSKYKVEGIQITIDGPRDVHDQRRMFRNGRGSFDQIVDGITEVIRKGIKVYLRANLDSQNLGSLPFLACYIQKIGWLESGLVFPYLYPMSDSGCLRQLYIVKETEVLEKILELSEKYPEMDIFQWRFHGLDQIETVLQGEIFSPMFRFCSATQNQYVFDPCGKIYACWWGVGRKEFEIGEFAPMLCWYWHNLEKWQNRSVLTIPECIRCRFALICGGGCTEKAIQEEGGIDKSRCSLFQEIISLGVPFLINKKYLS